MRRGYGCAVGAVLLLGVCAAADGQPARSEEALPTSAFFPILPWDPLHGWKPPYTEPKNGLESIAACEFTVSGFVRPGDLPLCEKLGLAAIIAPDRGQAPWFGDWTKLSDAEIDRHVKEMVEAAGKCPAVFGYFITDEPGVGEFPKLARVVEAVKKHAPGKLAYINLFPDYATLGAPDRSQLGTESYTEYLERFVAEVRPQVISYDNYMVQYSGDMADAKRAASYYRNLLEVRRVAMKHGLPFWNIVSSNQIRPHTPPPSPANLLFQAYTTLAAGAKGLSWYTYFTRRYGYAPIDAHGEKTPTWQYLRMVNHQLKTLGPTMMRLSSTGVFFTSPPPVAGLPLLPGRCVKSVAADGPMMVGEFTDAGGIDYGMVVNLSLERSVKFTLVTHKPDAKKQVVSAETGGLTAFDEKGLWLVAGQGALLRIEAGKP